MPWRPEPVLTEMDGSAIAFTILVIIIRDIHYLYLGSFFSVTRNGTCETPVAEISNTGIVNRRPSKICRISEYNSQPNISSGTLSKAALFYINLAHT